MAAALLAAGCLSLHAAAQAQTITGAFPAMAALQSEAQQLPQASAAAKRDFALFVQHHVQTKAGTSPHEFPLDVNDVLDLIDAGIGYGFQVYTINPKDLAAGRNDLGNLAKPTGIWRFAVMLHGQAIGLATVQKVNGNWSTVSYGAATLAKDVDATMGVHANAEHSNVRFLRIYQAQSDFLEVRSTRDSSVRYAPLHSARQSLILPQQASRAGGSSDGLSDVADFIEPLRAAVKSNMDNAR
jgi:hypothetical protein